MINFKLKIEFRQNMVLHSLAMDLFFLNIDYLKMNKTFILLVKTLFQKIIMNNTLV